jgi:hypothetical protein
MKTATLMRIAPLLLGLTLLKGSAYGASGSDTGSLQICPRPPTPCQPVWLITGSDEVIPPVWTYDATRGKSYPAKACDGNGCRTLRRSQLVRASRRPLQTPPRPILSAAAASDTQIALTWNPGTAIRTYNIYRSGKLIQAVRGNTTSFVDGMGPRGSITAPLEPDTSYCYTIAAVSVHRYYTSFQSIPLACARTKPAPPPLTITATYWPAGASTAQTWTVDEHFTCPGFCIPPGPTVHAGDLVQWSISGGHGPIDYPDIQDAGGFGILLSQVCSGPGCGGQYHAFCVPGASNGGHACYGSLPTGRTNWLDGIIVHDRAGHAVSMSILIRP